MDVDSTLCLWTDGCWLNTVSVEWWVLTQHCVCGLMGVDSTLCLWSDVCWHNTMSVEWWILTQHYACGLILCLWTDGCWFNTVFVDWLVLTQHCVCGLMDVDSTLSVESLMGVDSTLSVDWWVLTQHCLWTDGCWLNTVCGMMGVDSTLCLWNKKSVKRFEWSNGLDTALYKNYLYLYLCLWTDIVFVDWWVLTQHCVCGLMCVDSTLCLWNDGCWLNTVSVEWWVLTQHCVCGMMGVDSTLSVEWWVLTQQKTCKALWAVQRTGYCAI